MSKTETVENRLHKDREKIFSFVRKYENIYLYGIGNGAEKVKQYLDSEGYKISGFLVTDGESVILPKFADGYEVKFLSVADIDSQKDGIIVTVGAGKQDEIRKILANAGFIDNIYFQKIYFTQKDNDDDELAEIKYMNAESMGGTFFSRFAELNELGRKYQTDKAGNFHNYLNKYELFLNNLRDREFVMIELGVFNGSSLRMWNSYFSNAHVVGVDIDDKCKEFEGKNCDVIIADLSKKESILKLKELHPLIIVDDASHLWSHQISALIYLYDALPSGGIYILEDLGTSFSVNKNYCDASICAYDFCSAIAEVTTSKKPLRGDHLFKAEIESIGMRTEMISFICGSCIMIKK